MIRLDHVSKYFDGVAAVNDLSIEVLQGEVCVLIGPSGCGKTTTLRMINRLTEPDSGAIFVNGKDTRAFRPEDLRRSIGYAIQSVGLFPHLTVAANIGTVPELLHWDKRRIARRTEELLTLVGLDPGRYGSKYPRQLSGGEAQRVGVARALATDPPVLLMDEPFGAVDPLIRQGLQGEFARIQRRLKKTVILVTHDLNEAIRLADRIAVMRAGSLVQYDTPETVLARPADKFVHDFVGADRALKRLSRLSVKGYVRPARSVRITDSAETARSVIGQNRSVWVSDDDGRLVGWVDREEVLQANSLLSILVRIDLAEASVGEDATLQEALSRMLGQGFRYLPVLDSQGRLIGELSLHDIEAATAEKEPNNV